MKKHRLPIALLAVLCLFLGGCHATSLDDMGEGETLITLPDPDLETETTPAQSTTHLIAYREVEFLTDGEKAAWREPLLELFRNELPRYYGEKSLNASETDPTETDAAESNATEETAPGIEWGYYAGLLDIDTNGVPELLIDLGGGSAGNAYYKVYDILTGEDLGSLHGGYGDTWCMYLNSETGKFEAIARYTWRIGFSGRSTFVRRAAITHTMTGAKPTLYEYPLMEVYYEIDGVCVEVTPEESDAGITESWEEFCDRVTFYLDGERAMLDDYLRACNDFSRTRIRLPETALVELMRSDYEDDIERLVDDLLSTEQKFIRPAKPAETIETESKGG